MNPDKFTRNITLTCPTCGGTQFEYDEAEMHDDNAMVRCISCNREMTKAELLETNSESIDEHTKEIGHEVLNDAAKELTDSLKKAFANSKYIKMK